MFYRQRRRLANWRFNQAIGDVAETPPMPVLPAQWSIVSMVAAKDVPMYLVSMKAFYRRIGRGRLVAIVDRDLPDSDRDLLARHFPGIAFEILEDIPTGACQRGGTWERILYILDRSADEYVIQVDCDTLPVAADLREVVDCAERDVAFTMADGHPIQTMEEAAAAARAVRGEYIGLVSERLFDRYPDAGRLRYVRGSSGLAGFSRGGFTRAKLEMFHREMEALVGPERWREWGTEQCASNFAVANSAGACVLPYPAYTSFFPGGPRDAAKFFHFIGSHRFDDDYFADRCRREIDELRRAAVARRT